jgi:hypothetical protein
MEVSRATVGLGASPPFLQPRGPFLLEFQGLLRVRTGPRNFLARFFGERLDRREGKGSPRRRSALSGIQEGETKKLGLRTENQELRTGVWTPIAYD